MTILGIKNVSTDVFGYLAFKNLLSFFHQKINGPGFALGSDLHLTYFTIFIH